MIGETVMNTPAGRMMLAADELGLCAVRPALEGETPRAVCPALPVRALLSEAQRQLDEYFCGKRKAFDLPLSMHGGAFDQSVWRQLLLIPYGQTRTYGQLAGRLGRPGAARAVGAACGRNPLLIVVPCHRVVGSAGRLTGFAAGMDAKRMLLQLEGVSLQGDRIGRKAALNQSGE